MMRRWLRNGFALVLCGGVAVSPALSQVVRTDEQIRQELLSFIYPQMNKTTYAVPVRETAINACFPQIRLRYDRDFAVVSRGPNPVETEKSMIYRLKTEYAAAFISPLPNPRWGPEQEKYLNDMATESTRYADDGGPGYAGVAMKLCLLRQQKALLGG